jgi:VCBS repeat-containing protein
VSGPSHGTLTLNGDGTFSYTHDDAETTSDSFVYEVCDDGSPIECSTATVDITVNPVNDPPDAVNDSATVDEGGTITSLDGSQTSVLWNDSDPEGGTLTVDTTPVSGPSHGTLTLNGDGTFSYTHDGGETTSDSFVYEVCDDGSPVECSNAAVNITVNPVNDRPVVDLDGPQTPSIDDGSTVLSTTVTSWVSIMDSSLSVTDPDDTLLFSATVTIRNWRATEGLQAPSSPHTDVTFSNGVLTVTDGNQDASLADWASTLASIEYRDSNPATGVRILDFVINDGSADNDPVAVFTLTID